MPNYVTNQLNICAGGERLQEILDAIKFDGHPGTLDFNKVIPMPKSLEVESGTLTDAAISAYLDKLRENGSSSLEEELRVVSSMGRFHAPPRMTEERINSALEYSGMTRDELADLGKVYVDNQREYGAPTWFEWCTENWGTKWNLNPDDTRMSASVLEFETAWSPPEPIVEALSRKFPDVAFTINWADENIGSNVGERTYEAGKVTDEDIPEPGSDEAYAKACDILMVSPDDVLLTIDFGDDEPAGGSTDLDSAIQEAKQRAAEANKDAGREGKPHPAKSSQHLEL